MREGMKYVAAGMNPMDLKRGIDKAVTALVGRAEENLPKPTTTSKEIAQVGTISANSDTTIGEIIAEAMDKVGKEGVITVEDGKAAENELERRRKACSLTAATCRPTSSTTRKSKPPCWTTWVLLFDKKISNIRDLLPAGASGQVRPSAADHCRRRGGEALAPGGEHHPRHPEGRGVKAPGFGDRRKAMLEDIAIPDRRQGHRRRSGPDAGKGDPGRPGPSQAHRSGQGKHHHHRRCWRCRCRHRRASKQIRIQIEEATSDYDREKLQERVAKLAGGVAVIKVSAATEVEMKEKRRPAWKTPCTPPALPWKRHRGRWWRGLLRAKRLAKPSGRQRRPGRRHPHAKAIEAPARDRLQRRWRASVVVNAVLNGKGNYGFNAANDTYGDMIEMGILTITNFQTQRGRDWRRQSLNCLSLQRGDWKFHAGERCLRGHGVILSCRACRREPWCVPAPAMGSVTLGYAPSIGSGFYGGSAASPDLPPSRQRKVVALFQDTVRDCAGSSGMLDRCSEGCHRRSRAPSGRRQQIDRQRGHPQQAVRDGNGTAARVELACQRNAGRGDTSIVQRHHALFAVKRVTVFV